MAEAWYKEWCPKCETHNWICNGDETDFAGIDIEAIKCRQCGHIWTLGPVDEILMEISGYETVEDMNWEIGLETPN